MYRRLPLPACSSLIQGVLLVLVLLLLGGGCAHREMPGPVVSRISFRGNGGALAGTGDYATRAAMVQEASGSFSWLAPARRVSLNQDTLVLDAWRLETWFAHRGYFDARFRAWDVITVGPARRWRGPLVRIVGYVEPGESSRVRSIELAGLDIVGRPLLRLLRAQAPLKEGERFDLALLKGSTALVESRLREQGYAYATVSPQVTALPEEHAVDVVLSANLGPPCTFGVVTVEGDTTVSTELILAEIEIETGRPYQLSRLAKTQQRLFSLGVFSVVNIVPGLEMGPDGEPVDVIPVQIHVSQSRFRQVRIGGGFSFENARQEISSSATFTHVNLLNRLWRMELSASGGYASLLEWNQVAEFGPAGLFSQGAPIAGLSASLDIPRFPASAWRIENQVSFQLGVELEYQFASPEASTALVWQISHRWSSRLGYKIRYFDYFNSNLPADASLVDLSGRDLGLDFSDPYVLSFVFQQLKYDGRDDPLYPRRGSYSVLDLSEAGGPLGGQYNFVKALVDARIYRPMPAIFGWRPQITLTARIAGGLAAPFGAVDRAKVPFAERIYIGGSSTVRGWSSDHMGTYIYESVDPDTQQVTQHSSAVDKDQPVDDPNITTDDIIYIGGRVALYGGLEARGYWANGLGMAVFTDFGRAWDGAGLSSWKDLQARLSQLAPTVGAGLRYRSPVGPLRLDLATRLDSFPMFSQEPRFLVHIGLSEAW